MTNLYQVQPQKTFHGQTAGGILKTAKICKMQCGDYQVFVKDSKGSEFMALLSDNDHLVLSDYGVIRAVLYLSDTAEAKIRNLESKAANLYEKENVND